MRIPRAWRIDVGCRWCGGVLWLLVGAIALTGCQSREGHAPVRIENRVVGPMRIAVAPALNQSGSQAFDSLRVADIMAEELAHADGVAVIPVNRVASALRLQGKDHVESPAHAFELARLVGADVLLVFAITAYDPYDPPRIGMSAQLYGSRPGSDAARVDPVQLSRQASLVAENVSLAPPELLAQTQGVFDAAHGATEARLRRFAVNRGADASPYGWRRYMVSQQEFTRFCCVATLEALLNGQELGADAGSVSCTEGNP
jgi:hypothetical protein